jgi:hypothetical protein
MDYRPSGRAAALGSSTVPVIRLYDSALQLLGSHRPQSSSGRSGWLCSRYGLGLLLYVSARLVFPMFPSIMIYMKSLKENTVGLHVALKLLLPLNYTLSSNARTFASRV